MSSGWPEHQCMFECCKLKQHNSENWTLFRVLGLKGFCVLVFVCLLNTCNGLFRRWRSKCSLQQSTEIFSHVVVKHESSGFGPLLRGNGMWPRAAIESTMKLWNDTNKLCTHMLYVHVSILPARWLKRKLVIWTHRCFSFSVYHLFSHPHRPDMKIALYLPHLIFSLCSCHFCVLLLLFLHSVLSIPWFY